MVRGRRGEGSGSYTRRGKGLRLRPRRRPCPRIATRSRDRSDSSSSSSSDDQNGRSSPTTVPVYRGTRACTRASVRRPRGGRVREEVIRSSAGHRGRGRGRGKPPLIGHKFGRVKMSTQSRYSMRARRDPAKTKPLISHRRKCEATSTTSKKATESCDCHMNNDDYFMPIRIRNAKKGEEIMYEVEWDSGDVTMLESSVCSKLFPKLVINFLETVTRMSSPVKSEVTPTSDPDSSSDSE